MAHYKRRTPRTRGARRFANGWTARGKTRRQRQVMAMSEPHEINQGVPLVCPRCKKRTGELELLRRFCQNCGLEFPKQEHIRQEQEHVKRYEEQR